MSAIAAGGFEATDEKAGSFEARKVRRLERNNLPDAFALDFLDH
jgi:hypothetical protein